LAVDDKLLILAANLLSFGCLGAVFFFVEGKLDFAGLGWWSENNFWLEWSWQLQKKFGDFELISSSRSF
jgi:hypothetical protein